MVFKDSSIHVCSHCGTQVGKVDYCPDCKKADSREAMDEYNRKLWKEKGWGEYHCRVCEREQVERDRKHNLNNPKVEKVEEIKEKIYL